MTISHDDKISFLRKVFGSVHVPTGSGDPAVSCPKCKNPSKKKLAIRLDDDRVHCWVCGLGGRLLNILVTYRSSFVHEYITRFGKKTVAFAPTDYDKKPIELPKGFKLLAFNQVSNDPEVRWALNYLRKRGLTERDLWYFKFGISSDASMRRRVIMPSFDADGNLNYYTGRSIDEGAFRKYMNCDCEKKAIIFNELNIDWSQELTLVEGPFDLTKCDENATCLLGSSLSEDSKLFSCIYNHRTPIILALDSDMADKSWQRIARMLASYDIPVKILQLEGFKDVGEMTKDQFLHAKSHAVEWDRQSALLMKIQRVKL